MTPDDYGSPFMVTRRIADGLRRKAAEYRKGDKPQRAEGCDEDADALEALLKAYQEQRREIETLRASAPPWKEITAEECQHIDTLPVGLALKVYAALNTARAALNQKGDER
jgi:hypothetical protein